MHSEMGTQMSMGTGFQTGFQMRCATAWSSQSKIASALKSSSQTGWASESESEWEMATRTASCLGCPTQKACLPVML